METLQSGLTLKNLADSWREALEEHDRRQRERLRDEVKPWWDAITFRLAADQQIHLDIPRPEITGALKVSAAHVGAAGGLVYVRLNAEIRVEGGVVSPGTWTHVGHTDLQTPALPLHGPVARVFIFARVAVDGTLFLGSGKDALPG